MTLINNIALKPLYFYLLTDSRENRKKYQFLGALKNGNIFTLIVDTGFDLNT